MDILFEKQKKLDTPYQVKSNLATYKELDEQSRTIKAVANTLNFYDYDKDVLRPGSFNKSIQQRGSQSSSPDKIMHLLFHDLKRPVGKSDSENETTIDSKKVIYVESFLPETTDGENTLLNYKSEIYNQHSVGMNYIQIEYVEKDATGWGKFIEKLINPEEAEKFGYGWDVSEVMWFEWSTVTFGANKLTEYLGTKSMNKMARYDTINKKLNSLFKKALRREVKNKKLFDLQVKQLQQMILELTTIQPSLKDTTVIVPSNKGIELSGFTKFL